MIFHFLKLEQPASFSETVPGQTVELGYNYDARVEPVDLSFEAVPVQQGCSLSCSFAFKAVLPCARCLEDVPVSGQSAFFVELKPRSAMKPSVEEVDVDEEEEAEEIFIEGETFDTSELVRQQLLLLLPERVLCSDECKGLCPSCGTNRNESPCDCGGSDPRWAELKKLIE